MSIFRRDPSDDAASREPMAKPATPPHSSVTVRSNPQPEKSAATTVIATGTRLTGEVAGSANLTVEGHFDGKVKIDSDVRVGSGGQVKGEIVARTVRIAGTVHGDVKGLDLVELDASGSLEGNVSAARVIIAEGAFFKGQVEMTGERGKSGKQAAG